MQWLAALISPRSVAPHPNFRSVDRVTPAGILALVVRGEGYDRADYESRLERPLESSERELVESAAASLSYETIAEGAARLSELVRAKTVKDRALMTAAALLASTALADMDEVDGNLSLLQRASRRIPNRTDDEMLLSATLAQQRAMRTAEAGIAFEASRARAQDLLKGTDISQVSRYPTSQGSRWNSTSTNRRILAALVDANQDLFESSLGFPDSRTLKRLLRSDHSYLVSAMIRHAGAGEAAFVDESFASFAMSSERSVRSQDPVDSPVWQALMFFELIGHRRQARSLRAALGELRMMRSQGGTAANHEGLRLLRQAGDAKRLKLALNLVRGGGPLDALAHDTRRIVVNRQGPTTLREVELLTLESGAQLLDEETAGAAFNAVLAAVDDVPIVSPFRRELPAVQVEGLFKAAAALAPVAGRVSDFVERVLQSAEQIGATDDQLLVRAHERALWPVDWDEVSEATKQRWRAWLDSRAGDESGGWEPLINLLSPELSQERLRGSDSDAASSLDRIAHELNAVMGEVDRSAPALTWLREVAVGTVARQLGDARADATRGTFSMYAIDPADLAVALAQHADADIWATLVDYLLDPNIPRGSKSAALDRIAALPAKVPDFARKRLAEGTAELFAQGGFSSPFDLPEIEPFPAAVRVTAALGISSTEDLLSAIAVLAAGTTGSKLEAARTLSTVVAAGSPTPEWAIALALQLSNDSNANVRAETGRTLAVALQHSPFANSVLIATLMKLLAEDGMLVPLLVLRGFSNGFEIEAGPVVERVAQMAKEHPVFGVRVQARYVLERMV